MQVVYIDQFIITNLCVNYALFSVTNRMLRARATKFRLLLGSILGTAYAAAMLFPRTGLLFSIPGKLLFSLGMVAIVFPLRDVKGCVRTMTVFYLASFVFGGCSFAIINLIQKNIDGTALLRILIPSVAITYFALTFISWFIKQRAIQQSHVVKVEITIAGKTVCMEGLIDTGNCLCDPLTDTPVVVVDAKAIRPLLPSDWSEDLEENAQNRNMFHIEHRIRLIPFRSVGKEDGLMIGIRPDTLLINGQPAEAIIALSKHPVSSDETYFALIHPQLVAGY